MIPLRNTIVAALVSIITIAASPTGVATVSPAPGQAPSPPVAGAHDFCPLTLWVVPLDESRTNYVISLAAIKSARASGMMSLYAGDVRYDVAFANAVAVGLHDTVMPTPIVVHFPAPTRLDGAWISAIAGANGHACGVPFEPWTSGEYGRAVPKSPFALPRDRAAVAEMERVQPVDAPPPIRDPRCAQPDQVPKTITAATPPPILTRLEKRIDITVLVLLDQYDHVAATVLDVPSGFQDLNEAALEAARHSTYRGATFRCRPIVSLYRFVVFFAIAN